MSESVYTHDEKGKRVDVHAPSVINPGDYEYIKVGETRKHPVDGGPGGVCHHCGKAIRWEVHFRHVPSQKIVTFGYICAGILEMTDNRIDHEMNLLKRGAANEKGAAQEAREKEERTRVFKAQEPELYEFLTGEEINLPEWDNSFVQSMKHSLEHWGWLTDRQAEALKNKIKAQNEYMARRVEEMKKLEHVPKLDAGRRLIEGTILSVKWEPSPYNGDMVCKMRVEESNGNKVYGTMPKSIENKIDGEAKGVRVSFEAEIKPKEDHFGYFSRPKKGKVV
jgi:hypothetical protein